MQLPHMSEPLVSHEQPGSENRLQSVKVQKQPTLCQVEIHRRDNLAFSVPTERGREAGEKGLTEEGRDGAFVIHQTGREKPATHLILTHTLTKQENKPEIKWSA